MIEAVERFIAQTVFAYRLFRFYRRLSRDGTGYFEYRVFGVPQAGVFVAKGRESWRASHVAITAFEVMNVKEFQ